MRHRLLSLMVLFLTVTRVHAASTTPLVILFSNSDNGILKSCYCPNNPWGGPAKRAWLIEEIRKSVGRENVLLLSTGDFCPVAADRQRIPCLMRLYALMRYDAVAIGDQDLAGGVAEWDALTDTFSRYQGPPAFPWLSASYRRTSGAKADTLLARPWKIVQRGRFRIGLVSVAGPAAFRMTPPALLDGIDLADPVDIVRQFVEIYGEKTDVIVVLSHQGLDADRIMAQRVNGVDVIIGGHSQHLISPPEVVNGAVICQAGKNGENLGVLVLVQREATEEASLKNPNAARPPTEINARAFRPTLTEMPGWHIAQQLIPLDAHIEEQRKAAKIIDGYFDKQDARKILWMRGDGGAPPCALAVEDIVHVLSAEQLKMRHFSVKVRNAASSPLRIDKVRSKDGWLVASKFPRRLRAGERGEIQFRLIPDKFDRFLRGEYTVTTDDPRCRVVAGVVKGQISGPLPGICSVPSLMANLINCALGVQESAASDSDRTHRAVDETAVISPDTVLVEFFFSPGCRGCGEMRSEVLPDLKRRFGSSVDIREYDIYREGNYERLARLQETLKIRTNERISVYLNRRVHLGGIEEIRERMPDAVSRLLHRRETTYAGQPNPAATTAESGSTTAARLRSFTIGALIAAGVVDGINPCAFTTLIFFVTLLSVTYKRQRQLLVAGIAFSFAVFATYLLLGLGAFAFLLRLNAYRQMAAALRWIMFGVLILLALFSFRDARAYAVTGNPARVRLQLPAFIKRALRKLGRDALSTRRVVFGSLSAGFLVTLFESVCTGQVYIPTLALLTQHPGLRARAWSYLVLYNLMFVAPLIILFIAVYQGVRSERLLAWGRRNVKLGKILMGCLFLAMAGLLTGL